MDLKSLGEFGLIEHLTGRRKRCDEAVPVGIGDDAAVIRVPGNGSFLVCTDMLVEGIHFLRDKTPPAALGYKAMAVNFSDIAAMGGIPRQALVSVGWPADCSLAYVEEVYEGLYALADEYQVTIVGGDTVRAPFLVLNVTVLGEARERAVRRSGAKTRGEIGRHRAVGRFRRRSGLAAGGGGSKEPDTGGSGKRLGGRSFTAGAAGAGSGPLGGGRKPVGDD